MSAVRVAVVPHTHWDREWYATFEQFRGRLVPLLDEVLDLLETDPSYPHFLLDGQLALVEDYLAIRPDQESRVRRLVESGQVAVGPWYTLPDEFCVSGETLVRDLQLGLERAGRLGGAMAVGYLPDMFGHVAQMPQLLRLFGLERAVVWRGVPSAITQTAFSWSAPDGSSVRAEYLWHGYGNGSAVPEDAPAFVSVLQAALAEMGPALHGDLLWMNGTDHQAPQRWVGRVTREANALAAGLEIRVTSLAEALSATARADGDLPVWCGELRSGARANLLMGVLSNRVDVKQAAAAAERAVERTAEPLCALWMAPTAWPAGLLADAWLNLVRNAAHDSSCACSADDVCAAVIRRYRAARDTAEGLAGQGLAALAATVADAGLLIVNPTSRNRSGLVELDVPGEGPAGEAQVIATRPAVIEDRVLAGPEARAWLRAWRSQEVGEDAYLQRVEVAEDDDAVELTLHAGPVLVVNILVPPIRDDVLARLIARPGRRLHLRVTQPPTRRIVFRSDPVPGFGWVRWVPRPPRDPPVEVDGAAMSNGLIAVSVDTDGATFSIDDVDGLGRLCEGGDHGDTYNYCPPDHDTVVDRPVSTRLSVLERGPARGRLRVVAEYRWPEAVDGRRHRRVGRVRTVVTTDIELAAGERWARVRHQWDNHVRDHRVRAVFPLPSPASTSEAECAFAVVTRGLRAEGGPTERALATYPSRRFVRAGGLTVVHDGLLEYELTDERGAELAAGAAAAPALALTLLRSVGLLSRVDLPYRPLPAGPPLPVPGAQLQGPAEAAYAISVDPSVEPFAMADEVLAPLLTVRAPGGGPVTTGTGRALAVDGAEVSAVVRDGEAVALRVFNPWPDPSRVRLPGRSGWVVDLRGRPLHPFSEEVVLRAGQIATLRLDP